MEIKLLSCPLCLKPHFEGVDALRSTLVTVATSHLSCPVCSEILLGLDKLTIHLFSHINNVPATAKVTPTQEDDVHEEIDKTIDSISKKCKKLEDDTEETNEIVASTKMEEEIVVKCDICNFSFTDQTILDMHQKLLHHTTPDKKTGNYSYHCHLCSKKFRMRGSLMVHLRVAHYGFGQHHNSESDVCEKKKPCTVTSDLEGRVKEEKDVNVEVKSPQQKIGLGKVQDNKQWECDVCSKMFTTKYFLKKHKRLHTGEMPYCCTLCNKSFTFQQSYHKHMLYHSSEKPYVCNECGRAFKELSTLQNHARIHSGERPFGCETCGKRFRQRVSYLVHRRIHTGAMPYKCTACNKSFRYKVSQRSHKCPMNPPGSVIRIPDVEKIPDSNIPSPKAAQNNGICIMSVNLNTGNINFVPDEEEKVHDGLFTSGGCFQETVQIQKESIVLNSNEQIEIRYNKADLHSAITSTQSGHDGEKKDEKNVEENSSNNTSGPQNSLDNFQKMGYTDPEQDLFSMVLSPILPEVESLCLNNSPSESLVIQEETIAAMGKKCLEEFLYGLN